MTQSERPDPPAPSQAVPSRRTFVGSLSTVAMAGGLLASYGSFFAIAIRYLFPAHARERAWMYLAQVAALKRGETRGYTAPTGESIAVVRKGDGDTAEDFIALSSTCPHLGCKVHWEAQNNRFFCPCHNGVFTPEGEAIEGPPAQAGQWLSQYPLRVEFGLLYIEVPVEGVESP